MSEKTVSPADQALIEALQKAQAVGGEIYDGAKSVAGKAIDIATEQAPDLVHQLIVFNIASCIVAIIVAAIIMYYGFSYTKKIWPDIVDHPEFMISMPAGVISFIVILVNAFELLKLTLAPKIWLIEYVAKLVK